MAEDSASGPVTATATDEVHLESRTVSSGSEVVYPGVLLGPADALVLHLKSGASLGLDAHTPAGTYTLSDGRILAVHGAKRYPRSYSWAPKPQMHVCFHVTSQVHVGVVVLPERSGELPSNDSLARVYRRSARGYVALRGPYDGSSVLAGELDPGSFQRGCLGLGDVTQGRHLVAWIALHPLRVGTPAGAAQDSMTPDRGWEAQAILPEHVIKLARIDLDTGVITEVNR